MRDSDIDNDALPWGPIRFQGENIGKAFDGTGALKLSLATAIELYEIAPEEVAHALRRTLRQLRERGWIGGRNTASYALHAERVTICQALAAANEIPNPPFNLHVVARAALEECARANVLNWNEVRGRHFGEVEALFLRAIYVADNFENQKRSARA